MQPNIDVNAPDFSGFTPLHVAVMLKLQGCAALLMAVGADPDAEIIEKVCKVSLICQLNSNCSPITLKSHLVY